MCVCVCVCVCVCASVRACVRWLYPQNLQTYKVCGREQPFTLVQHAEPFRKLHHHHGTPPPPPPSPRRTNSKWQKALSKSPATPPPPSLPPLALPFPTRPLHTSVPTPHVQPIRRDPRSLPANQSHARVECKGRGTGRGTSTHAKPSHPPGTSSTAAQSVQSFPQNQIRNALPEPR